MSPVYKFSNVGGFLTKNLYTSALAGNTAVVLDQGSMFPLGTFTLSQSSATVEFTNIPQTYTHLQLRVFAREATGGDTSAGDQIRIRFNSDSTASYSVHRLWGNGTSALADGYGNETSGLANGVSGSGSTSNVFSAGVVDILDYRNTNKNKTVKSLMGADLNGSGSVWMTSSAWYKTNAITTILLTSTYTFAINSSFALYGIKA